MPIVSLTFKNRFRLMTLTISLVLPMMFLFIAPQSYPFNMFTEVEIRIAAIFIMAALLWILEPIPNFSTSLLVIVLELITISDKGFIFFRKEGVGELVPYKDIMAAFSAPIIILFLGGFTLAFASSKYKLDYKIAKTILVPFGKNPNNVLLGFMLITAVFSMFMSNTATTAMMLSVLMPVFKSIPKESKIRVALALGIPIAANIGGMGTPIGTPPNAIALRALGPDVSLNFSKWMMFSIPFVLVLLLFSWIVLIICFRSKGTQIRLSLFEEKKEVSKEIGKEKRWKKRKSIIVSVTFVFTILLWMTDFIHGMNSYIVAMIPMLIFFIMGICTKEDLKMFNWDVLWLVAGGIAIGVGLEKTGLSDRVTSILKFDNTSFTLVIIISMGIMYILSNFMSHTAASNLLIPLLVAIGYAIPDVLQSDIVLLIISVTFAASLSMLLPISTPPNALAYGTGLIKTKHLVYFGLLIGVVGMGSIYFYLSFIRMLGFF